MEEQSLLIRRDYPPWCLGFCQWEVGRLTIRGRGNDYELLRRGNWKWRGWNAPLRDTLLDQTVKRG